MSEQAPSSELPPELRERVQKAIPKELARLVTVYYERAVAAEAALEQLQERVAELEKVLRERVQFHERRLRHADTLGEAYRRVSATEILEELRLIVTVLGRGG